MKLGFVLMSTCIVIVSCYHQYYPGFMMQSPWLSPIRKDAFFNYQPLKYPQVGFHDMDMESEMEDDSIPRIKAFYLPAPDTEARINKIGFNKWFAKPSGQRESVKNPPVTKAPIKKPTVTKPSKKPESKKPPKVEKSPEDKQAERFLYQLGYNLLFNKTAKSSALLKTVTFTLTSTCTALTFTTCIPSSGLVSPIVVCNAGRRRRDAFMIDAVNPTATLPLVPTLQAELPSSEETLVSRRSIVDIVSSKEDTSDDSAELRTEDDLQKQQRFIGVLGYSLWQAFATGTTVTSWSVTSTTITQTINPPAGTPFPCLPSGITTCAAAVTIG